MHDTAFGDRPDELAALKSLREQTRALAVMPDDLDQITASAAEDKQVTDMRILGQGLLHQQ